MSLMMNNRVCDSVESNSWTVLGSARDNTSFFRLTSEFGAERRI